LPTSCVIDNLHEMRAGPPPTSVSQGISAGPAAIREVIRDTQPPVDPCVIRLEVEQIPEEALLLPLAPIAGAVVAANVGGGPAVVDLRRSSGRAGVVGGDDLVELATIEPHSTALGAVVDLDSLPLAHMQDGLVNGAFHPRNRSQ
jgi:hypothetical protein